MKYIFAFLPSPGTELLRTLGFPKWSESERWKKSSVIHNKNFSSTQELCWWGGFGKAPKWSHDGGWLPEEPTMWRDGCHFSAPPPDLQEGKRSWRLCQSPKADGLINNAYVMKPQMDEAGNFQVGEHVEFWECGTTTEGPCVPLPTVLPCASLLAGCSWVYPL